MTNFFKRKKDGKIHVFQFTTRYKKNSEKEEIGDYKKEKEEGKPIYTFKVVESQK